MTFYDLTYELVNVLMSLVFIHQRNDSRGVRYLNKVQIYEITEFNYGLREVPVHWFSKDVSM